MKKINMTVEIVSSSVNELSSMNDDSRRSVLEILSKHYSDVKITLINDITDLNELISRQPDLVFLGMKFIPGNLESGHPNTDKIWISEHLDRNNITYTGSNQSASQLEFNKELAKDAIQKAGLKTAKFYIIKDGKTNNGNRLPEFPLFVKPTDQGGGTGIDSDSLVHNLKKLNAKTASIFSELGSDSLVEEYLSGREFSVAILKSEDSFDYSLMPIELVAPADATGNRFLSAKIKKTDSETFESVTDQSIFSELTELAMDAFIALGARDYGRIDIRLDARGTPHFLEANLIPSLLKNYGNFPKACLLNIGLQYEEVILRIVNLAINRKPISSQDNIEFVPTIKTVPIAI